MKKATRAQKPAKIDFPTRAPSPFLLALESRAFLEWAACIASWPLLTAIGLLGYRLYSRRRYPAAHACLTLYSLTGIATLGHFLDGSPNIPAFWYATIFTDGLAGFAVLAFTAWSVLATSPGARGARA